MSEKRKLTLSVNKEVVDKAKKLGINISEITESVLKGFVFTPKVLDDDVIYQHYDELFNVMLPLMEKYKFHVDIAQDVEFDDNDEVLWAANVSLEPEKVFYVDQFDTRFTDIKKIDVNDFHPPLTILETFLSNMTNAVEKRRENIKEIEMAKRIVQAIALTVEDKTTSG
jgi:hypothetical protein